MPMFGRFVRRLRSSGWIAFVLVGLLTAGLFAGAYAVRAQSEEPGQPPERPTPLHPSFPLLDQESKNVLASGNPASPMTTCGACHDTTFIAQHSYHSDLGLSDIDVDGIQLAQPWDLSRGLFGKWDPLTNRVLSAAGADRMDLSTADWLKLHADRVPGGGPATTSRSGDPLVTLPPDPANPETASLAEDGAVRNWDWKKSGVVELDCFLCHLPSPDADARTQEIRAGNFAWANSATLLSTGIITRSADGFAWQPEAFDADGELKQTYVRIQDPTNENCAACHGVVHTDQAPLLFSACDPAEPQTATTGQVISAQSIAASGLNLKDKASLTQSWDIHAERGLNCTDCHYALNNPIHVQEAAGSEPSHLLYDPRRLDLGEYLERPNHNFARGQSAQFTVAAEEKGSMRRCESCHAAEKTHASWLPYTARHLSVLACESCHIPQMHAPAIESTDWTVLRSDGSAVTTCRGIEGTDTVNGLVTGFQPVLMKRSNIDGSDLLAPYNLVTSWYWVYDDPAGVRPVRQVDLASVFLDKDEYTPEIINAFDTDRDGVLSDAELVIDSDAKENLIQDKLVALGLKNPRIEGQVQPYSINHGVARGEYVTRDCQTCHSAGSTLGAAMVLADRTPGGVIPTFVSDANVASSGTINSDNGRLFYRPIPANDDIYVFGRDGISLVDWLGALFFVGTLLAVLVHATARYIAHLRRPKHQQRLEKVFMYQAYERLWHWLQSLAIILLLLTGIVIHRPDMFGMFSFSNMVFVHNLLAAILVINAALSLFWHLAGGEIRQFIPRPYGFFDQAIEQAKYYLQGIFSDAPHPFEKTRERHLNPLQQITYFGILNVLLPLQIVTGALMWGAQRVPNLSSMLGGLSYLAPFHTLIAWLFASFIVAHIYLTTMGPRPLVGISAIVTGWDEVEVAEGSAPAGGGVAGGADETPQSIPSDNRSGLANPSNP